MPQLITTRHFVIPWFEVTEKGGGALGVKTNPLAGVLMPLLLDAASPVASSGDRTAPLSRAASCDPEEAAGSLPDLMACLFSNPGTQLQVALT